MDPTSAEIAAFTTVAAVAAWAGFEGDLTDQATTGNSLLRSLGLTTTQAPRVLGIIAEDDFKTAVGAWRISTGPDADGNPTSRAPTLAEVGQASLFGRACRLVAGNGDTLEELRARAKAASSRPTPPAPRPPSPTGTRKIKMNTIASQVDDSEFELAPEADLMRCFRRYESVYGKGERPEHDQEPTPEQVSAVMCILRRGSPPYVDFAVFGPHGHRIMKKVKLSGVNIGRDGTLQTVELYGPANIGMWEASYNVLLNVLVMLNAVDLGVFMSYKQHIMKLHDRYSSKVWAIIYQADVRCRLEHMERTRRVLQAQHEEAVAKGQSTDYDDTKPWNLVFRRVVSDDNFWRDQVLEPSLLQG